MCVSGCDKWLWRFGIYQSDQAKWFMVCSKWYVLWGVGDAIIYSTLRNLIVIVLLKLKKWGRFVTHLLPCVILSSHLPSERLKYKTRLDGGLCTGIESSASNVFVFSIPPWIGIRSSSIAHQYSETWSLSSAYTKQYSYNGGKQYCLFVCTLLPA